VIERDVDGLLIIDYYLLIFVHATSNDRHDGVLVERLVAVGGARWL
jgi:hypothetical protein